MKKLLPKLWYKSARNPSGFTLIELLVVITIIAILAVIGLAIFSGVQSRARNAKRRQDVIAIGKGMEVNKGSTSATYPVISGSWFAGGNVPQEGTGGVPQYALIYLSAITASQQSLVPPVYPSQWSETQAVPSGAATNPSGGSPLIVNLSCTPPTPCAGPIPGAATVIYAFEVCTLLESETIGSTTRSVFCYQSAQ